MSDYKSTEKNSNVITRDIASHIIGYDNNRGASSRGVNTRGSDRGRGRGMDTRGRGMDTRGRGMDNRGRGMDNRGRGMDNRGRGMDNRGSIPRGRGMDNKGRGTGDRGRGYTKNQNYVKKTPEPVNRGYEQYKTEKNKPVTYYTIFDGLKINETDYGNINIKKLDPSKIDDESKLIIVNHCKKIIDKFESNNSTEEPSAVKDPIAASSAINHQESGNNPEMEE